jgi:hypothetical protein
MGRFSDSASSIIQDFKPVYQNGTATGYQMTNRPTAADRVKGWIPAIGLQ